jgi:hypothetical protein
LDYQFLLPTPNFKTMFLPNKLIFNSVGIEINLAFKLICAAIQGLFPNFGDFYPLLHESFNAHETSGSITKTSSTGIVPSQVSCFKCQYLKLRYLLILMLPVVQGVNNCYGNFVLKRPNHLLHYLLVAVNCICTGSIRP